jgi:hypothetical protein
MIYLVGGAPRTGKSVLGQKVAAHLNIGWVATDVLRSMLKAEGDGSWDATPGAITQSAEWFFPHLQRFVCGMSSLADDYLIEGVHFLPSHAAALAKDFALRSVFLGCSTLTLERFDKFPGRSRGYAALPLEFRQQIVRDVPTWSAFVAERAKLAGCHYLDMVGGFAERLAEAELVLTQGQRSDAS